MFYNIIFKCLPVGDGNGLLTVVVVTKDVDDFPGIVIFSGFNITFDFRPDALSSIIGA